MPNFIKNNDVITVSSQFISEKLPSANATFVKVYLYALMLAQTGRTEEYREIANTLGILESDLMQAFKFWESEGELSISEDSIVFGEASLSPVPAAEPVAEIGKKQNVADIISSNQELTDMFMLVQEILGKTITESDMQTIYWFYSDLKLPVSVILMLLEYCVSKGKNRLSYIEKVAVSWNEMGLNNPEAVNDYLKSEEQRTGFLYSIRKLMGISDRSLSQIEEQYLTKWHEEYLMSEEMVALAYEYCIIQTAKLSFPYMDKIITRWHTEGITTIEQAENDNKKFKSRSKAKDAAFTDNEYDGVDLERRSRSSKKDN